MRFNYRDFTYAARNFANSLKNNLDFQICHEIARTNSDGPIWLIGGFLYKGIISKLYNKTFPSCDFDFLVEGPKENFHLPLGWNQTRGEWGNPRFTHAELSINYLPIEKTHFIYEHGLTPRIENFLAGTSLNVQSLALQVENHKLLGRAGIEGIMTGTVKINNHRESEYVASKTKLHLEDYLREKAKHLGFCSMMVSQRR
jgi:hypothetical protein